MNPLLFLSTIIFITFYSPNLESLTFKLARLLSQTQTYDQVLLDPDIEDWKKSAHKETSQLESKDTWVEIPTSEPTSNILPGRWVFCHKRAPTGIVSKFKARYCVRGDLQEDTHCNLKTSCLMEHNQACTCLHTYSKLASPLCGFPLCLCPS